MYFVLQAGKQYVRYDATAGYECWTTSVRLAKRFDTERAATMFAENLASELVDASHIRTKQWVCDR